jgi:hypothetical protein
MELVLGELKGVLSDSVSKFLKENVKFEESDIKSIFGDSMDKVLYHDEGFIKEVSNKMSDVIMPAYMKELRYLKTVVKGVDKMTLSMKELQDRLAVELKSIVPNPQNHDDTLKRVNVVMAKFIDRVTKIAEKDIGLREVTPEDKKIDEIIEAKKMDKETDKETDKKKHILPTPKAVADAFSQNVLSIIKLKDIIKQKGGSSQMNQSSQMHQSPNVVQTPSEHQSPMITGGSPSVHQSPKVEHVPQVDPKVFEYFTEEHPVKIPEGNNFTKPNGNLSNQIGNILGPYIAKKRKESAKEMEELENSKTYQNTISSLNNLLITNPSIPPEKINILLELIMESGMSVDELNKIIEQIQNKKNSNKRRGGTRKKRY